MLKLAKNLEIFNILGARAFFRFGIKYLRKNT